MATLSVWVTKEGNDSNPNGPFLTIGAARTYLKNNQTLSSAQHGLILIGPGVWNEIINIEAGDEDRYIDYEGSGIDVTFLQGSSTAFVHVNVTTAENRFSNMTIEYNGSTDADCAVDINVGFVVISDCKIKSTRRCIKAIAENSVVQNCTIISSATNAESVINGLTGTLVNCAVKGQSLAVGGHILYSLGATGRLLNCQLSSVSTLGTPPAVSCLNDVMGVIIDCRFESQGQTANMIQSGAIVEKSYFSTEGTGGSKVVDQFRNALITQSVFHQKGNSSGVISRVMTSISRIYHCVFMAPNSSSSVIGAVEVDGTEWYDCAFNNNGTAGFALDANAAGRTIKVGNITSNRPLDPEFAVLNSISDNGALNVTGVKASAYTTKINELVCCNPTAGAFTVTLPAISAVNRGMTIVVKNQSASTNVITIARAGANTIDGAASITINTARGCRRLVSDGTSDWLVL